MKMSVNLKSTDLEEALSPVTSFPTLRLFLSVLTEENLELHQVRDKTGRFYRGREQDILMEWPEVFDNGLRLDTSANEG